MAASERAQSRDCIYIVFGCTWCPEQRFYILCLVVLKYPVPRAVAVKSGKIFQPLLVNRTAHIVAFCKKNFCNKT